MTKGLRIKQIKFKPDSGNVNIFSSCKEENVQWNEEIYCMGKGDKRTIGKYRMRLSDGSCLCSPAEYSRADILVVTL